jgi:hypothetical protein
MITIMHHLRLRSFDGPPSPGLRLALYSCFVSVPDLYVLFLGKGRQFLAKCLTQCVILTIRPGLRYFESVRRGAIFQMCIIYVERSKASLSKHTRWKNVVYSGDYARVLSEELRAISRTRRRSSVRLLTFDFSKMCLMWFMTVYSLMHNRSAISPFSSPSQTREVISISRSVNRYRRIC